MEPNYAALSASDGAGEPVRATVQSPGRSIGSSTIPVNATTNWPTGTFIATTGTLLSNGTLDPTTVQVFYGTASGTDITITAYAAGYTDKGNSAGDVVVIKPTTEWANIVAEGILGTTQFPANFANFVESGGGVWSAGAGLVGSGTAGYVWYNGARSAMATVTNHTFAASKDTYIDYNPVAATWTYVPETNGAAEPAVTASSIRIAKVVTGASSISSVTQAPYQAQIHSSNIDFNSLFGGDASNNGIRSYTNTGFGGGTGYYINLGGLKICWGTTGSATVSGGNVTISLPSSFFTTVQTTSHDISGGAAFATQLGLPTTTSTITIYFGSGGSSAQISWLVIGT